MKTGRPPVSLVPLLERLKVGKTMKEAAYEVGVSYNTARMRFYRFVKGLKRK